MMTSEAARLVAPTRRAIIIGSSPPVPSASKRSVPLSVSNRNWPGALATGLAFATIRIETLPDGMLRVAIMGVDVFKPQTGEVLSEGKEGIALWMIDTDYNEESFFVRHAYFLGANDPYRALKTTLKAEIDEDAWATLNSDVSRPFAKPASGRIAVKVINHLGDEVMKVFAVG